MNSKLIHGGLLAILTLAAASCEKDPYGLPEDWTYQREVSSTTGIDQFSDPENIYTRNVKLVNAGIQGFTLIDENTVYYCQTSAQTIYFTKAEPSPGMNIQTLGGQMFFYGFSHGTNSAVEHTASGDYVWVGAYGKCDPTQSNTYWTNPVVGRVKFQAEKKIYSNECEEYYWLGKNITEIHPSIDAENGLVTFVHQDPEYASYRCFNVYKLSEARQAPVTTVTFRTTDAFKSHNLTSTEEVSVTLSVRDLTQVTPVAVIRFPKSNFGQGTNPTFYSWQGFDVHKDKLYYMDGEAKGTDIDQSYAYLTIFNFKSRVVERRTLVSVVQDATALLNAGISTTASLESEGCKVFNGKLYLGFSGKGCNVTGADANHWYTTIFRYNPSQK